MNVFTFIDIISYKKADIDDIDVHIQKEYVPFVVNKHFSLFPDTIFHANLINSYSFLSKKTQYEYLKHALRKRKRYTKWHKKQNNQQLNDICEYYNCSKRKAKEYENVLTPSQLARISNIIKSKNV